MDLERDEIAHKMSKKIAQLTKVIFHLNTKNDEWEMHLKAVVSQYECEVTDIIWDANNRVKE